MPRKYIRKTENVPIDPDTLFEMMKAVKIGKENAFAVSKNYGIKKDTLYRAVAAFDQKVGTDVEITEEMLEDFVKNRKKVGASGQWCLQPSQDSLWS